VYSIALILLLVFALAVAASRSQAPTTSAVGSRVPLGVQTHSIRELSAFDQLVGRPVTHVVLYADDSDWHGLSHPWFLSNSDPDKDWDAWARADRHRRLVISEGMVPTTAPADWRQRGAAGDYDGYWRILSRALAGAGLHDVIVRLGWEMNGDWYPGHYVGSSSRDRSYWLQYYQRIVATIRQASGVHVAIDWNPSAHTGDLALDNYYPGDEFVDILGLDVYDTSYGRPDVTAEQRWREQLEGAIGVMAIAGFAKRHGKPLSFPEWALVAPGDPSGSNGAGDNPRFIGGMADIMKGTAMAYQAYFNVPGGGVGMTLRDAPQSLAVFRLRFGTAGDV
jgi:Glycosyl hydrolase family 26